MATVREIAKKADVSIATVSRVLNSREYVRNSLRERVVRVARELGYEPEQPNVAILIHDAPGFTGYSGCMLNALLIALAQGGYRAEVIQTRDLELLSVQSMVGAIAMVLDNGIEQIWARTQHLPLVCMNTKSRHFDNIFTVSSNNRQGITMAMDYFRRNGHGKIAYAAFERIHGNYFERDNSDIKERYDCYIKYMQNTGEMAMTVNSAANLDAALAAGYRAFLAVGEANPVAIYSELSRRNLHIPDEVSVITFAHPDLTRYLAPEPTTIGQNFPAMAQLAVELLEKLAVGQNQCGDMQMDYLFHEGGSVRNLLV